MNAATVSALYRDTPIYYLQHARALACVSAVGYAEPPPQQIALIKLMGSSTFRPNRPNGGVDFANDCRPYIPVTHPIRGTFVFMDTWARAGVRYLKPGFDLSTLAPQSFYTNWWHLYQTTFPEINPGSAEDQIFNQMFASLGDFEPDILVLIDQGKLMLDPKKIKRLLTS